MSTFYAVTAATFLARFAPWSGMRDKNDWSKGEATRLLNRGASASFLILQHSLAKACPEAKPKDLFARLSSFVRTGGKRYGMIDVHLFYHDFILPHEIYDLFH